MNKALLYMGACDYFDSKIGNYKIPHPMSEFQIMPILRPLSDMTEEEAIELTKPVVMYGWSPNMKYETYRNSFGKIVVTWGDSHLQKNVPQDATAFVPEQIPYLLEKRFDIFNLFDKGECYYEKNGLLTKK
jgi:hypothetical protein